SLTPGRTYAELSGLARELTAATADLADLRTHSDVGLLVSPESRWALEFQGPIAATPHSWSGDPTSFEQILASCYRGLFDAGLAVDVVGPRQLPDDPAAMVARWPVLVVAGMYVASDATLDLLVRYADAGGHLVLTPRTGYATEENVIRPVVAPGVLAGPAGVHYLEFTNLPVDVPVTGDGWSGSAHAWADGLLVDDAETLAGYDHPHLSQFAAITTKAHGAGRVTTVGTLPDRTLGAELGRWLATTSVPADPWRDARPASVTVHSAHDPAGRRLRVVHNWSWDPATVTLPTAADDVLSGAALAAGDALELGPWDVRVVRERSTA
ncbi:MAG: beta-galactosidase, partial [Cellulomonadaceae bacterium]|nr:beta-galactosidase [Cellulomonadaceae bacterium]